MTPHTAKTEATHEITIAPAEYPKTGETARISSG